MHILAAIWLKAIKRYARNSLFESNQFSTVNHGNERRKAKRNNNNKTSPFLCEVIKSLLHQENCALPFCIHQGWLWNGSVRNRRPDGSGCWTLRMVHQMRSICQTVMRSSGTTWKKREKVCISFHTTGAELERSGKRGKGKGTFHEEYLPSCDEEFWNNVKHVSTTGVELERMGRKARGKRRI